MVSKDCTLNRNVNYTAEADKERKHSTNLQRCHCTSMPFFHSRYRMLQLSGDDAKKTETTRVALISAFVRKQYGFNKKERN